MRIWFHFLGLRGH